MERENDVAFLQAGLKIPGFRHLPRSRPGDFAYRLAKRPFNPTARIVSGRPFGVKGGDGRVVRQPVSQVDFMPTILDYAGLPAPERIHGRSMRPLVEGREVAWRDHAFCQRAGAGRMLRTERYKYVYREKPRVTALYDLQTDPHEDRNLAADARHAAAVRQMHRRLLEVMAADGDPMHGRLAKDPLA